MKRLATLFASLFIVLCLTTGTSCQTPGGPQVDASPVAIVKQALTLAETTATAANYMAVTLSKSGDLSVQQLKDVQVTTRTVNAAVQLGFTAVDRGDTATAQQQIALIAVDLIALTDFIAKKGATP